MTALPAGVHELSFTGPPQPADPAPLTVTFTQDGTGREILGFWDGGRNYLARFSPSSAGTWRWRTRSEEPALDGLSGEIEAAEPAGPGPVQVVDTYHFAHADGTPFRPVGTTVYNWIHQEPELRSRTLEAVSDAGFNKLRFMVFPQGGGYVEHVPELMPFERDSAGRWDTSRPVSAYFRQLDDAVMSLAGRGVVADVLLLSAYSADFGLDALTEEEDATYLRYVVARLGAYPNVWWSLCNEFDILGRPVQRWDRLGELLARIDGHQRLRSIHNWVEFFDHNRPWVTHASIQDGASVAEPGRASAYRDAYLKPIVLDEIKYEGDVPLRWGHLSARELVHRFWVATVSGCYASHGESFVKANGSLHMVDGGPFRGMSPARLDFLRRILDALHIAGLDPIDKWDDPEYVAGQARRQYVRYFGRSAPATWTFRLPQGHHGERLEVGDQFQVDIIDTWNMTVLPVERTFTLTEVHRNDAFADGPPLLLPEGEAIALRITRRQ
ncbi:DUF4038 domain-containing protein [Bogoriella caseilytica]|uniref:Uncharacterized protein DUF5060 n=1 Tax=Bogoriella caseilytica TaxID=56055 RepID=A0A3N2BAY0_9MICO|nr:DUF4038 domain-containing protein [Bogoriella caseilytica]ROR72419.1 uncharacterized protein DUF5060 [Bogoriella caseilytica]